ncbi:MAG: hypothetical protein RL685_1969 [Pseudomonadota bacterium]|jgi:glucose/arabinose dehydrogenase
MSHLLRPKSFAALSLVLVSSGLIAVACSSDKSTSTETPSLTPGNGSNEPNPPASNNAGTSATPDPANPAPPGSTPGATPGNEGPMGNIPVEQPGETMNPPGNTPPGAMNPPPAAPQTTVNCSAPEGAVPNLTVQQVGTFTQPLFVTSAPGDDSRLFVMEKGGAIRVVVNGQTQEAPFITLQVANGGERGLLGMAFHPDFQTNGLFYAHFSSPGGDDLPALGGTVVAEYQAPGDRSVADPATRRVLFTLAQPAANHNGGQLTFGLDKMLYLGLGDGGGGNDQFGAAGNGQNLNALLGKILRFDPLGREVNNAYSIPAGNLAAVTGQAALPEIWAYGVRNPWRFSFDPCNGDLYIGDVGQNAEEEISFVAADEATRLVSAGRNFGWRVAEGTICRPSGTEPCNAQVLGALTGPIDSYPAGNAAPSGGTQGGSVTGGFVYRGSAIPGLRGTYLYADYIRGTFVRFRVQDGQAADRTDITMQLRAGANFAGQSISSFGMDNQGEMYIASFNPAGVYKIVAAQ